MKQKLLLITCLVTSNFLVGQTITRIEVKGFLYANANEVESVAIYNTSSSKGTITNEKGEFVLEVAENDVIEISALQFEMQKVTITKEVIESKSLKIYLVEQVNELNEVTVGNRLTGDLLKDINNIEGKPPINFYDVGIPGYTGKIATQSERVMNEATTGPGGQKLKWYSPLTGTIPLNPIINGISGRTKMLKERVNLEEREALIQSIKGRLAKDFFMSYPLKNHLKMEFLYFCADDESFIETCKNQTDFEVYNFLILKYTQFLQNKNGNKD